MSDPRPAWLSWSSGKDSAWALHLAEQQLGLRVVALLTTVSQSLDRVAVHGVRRELLEAQAARLGRELVVVELPHPCPNAVYEARMGEALARARERGVRDVVFGDIFLEDIREYRARLLAPYGLEAHYPLWERATPELAAELVAGGVEALVCSVNTHLAPRELAGRCFDAALLADLPLHVDPCGENGEFHTFVYNGPGFSQPIAVTPGADREHDGFVSTDLLPG